MENRKPRLRESLVLKIIAVFVAVVCFVMCFFSGVLTMICVKNNVYNDGGEKFLENSISEMADSLLERFSNSFLRRAYYLTMNDEGILNAESVTNLIHDDLLFRHSDYIFVMQDMTEDGPRVNFTTAPDEELHTTDQYSLMADGYPLTLELRDNQPREIQADTAPDFRGLNDLISDLDGFTGTAYASLSLMHSDSLGNIVEEPIFRDPIFVCENGELTNFTAHFAKYLILSKIIENYTCDYFVNGHFLDEYDEPELDVGETAVRYAAVDPSTQGIIYEIERIYNDYSRSLYGDVTSGNRFEGLSYIPMWNQLSAEERSRIFDILTIEEYCDNFRFEIDGSCYGTTLHDFTLSLYLSNTPTHNQILHIANTAVEMISEFARFYPIVMLASGMILLFLLIFLTVAAGERTGHSIAVPCWFDKIPFELFLLAAGAALGFLVLDYVELVYRFAVVNYGYYRISEMALFIVLIPVAAGLASVLSLMTLSTRLKAGVFWKYTFVGIALWICRFVLKGVKKFFGVIGYVISQIPLAWKIVLFVPAVVFMNVVTLLMAFEDDGEFILFWMLLWAGVYVLLLLWCIGFARIRKYANKVAKGENTEKINRKYLFGDLKRMADDLEGVGEGVKKAVDEKMRSERLKTELIANVSHDLKTPLTSIVNYVDILSKDDIQSPQALEHIDILKRQAARMKKLIEDLVEVSKASSGNISANLERTDVNLLVTQSAAEYAEKFRQCKLEPIISMPNKKQIANLDGRLMWRVLDNLYGNICKYAMPNTRVYITAEDLGASVRVSFKNISRYQLNMSVDDLMERFVRGDSSRNTEGSGLGLSIAKNFCDLQKVWIDITIDGDLFKVDLLITKVPNNGIEEEEISDYTVEDTPLRTGQRTHVVQPETNTTEEEKAPCEPENCEALISAPTMPENEEEHVPSDEKEEPSDNAVRDALPESDQQSHEAETETNITEEKNASCEPENCEALTSAPTMPENEENSEPSDAEGGDGED